MSSDRAAILEALARIYANAAYQMPVTNTSVASGLSRLSSENIIDAMESALECLTPEPDKIPVWVGDKKLCDLPECPPFIESDLVDEDSLYIAAGIGIVLGTNVISKIWEIGYLSEWVLDPPKRKDT